RTTVGRNDSISLAVSTAHGTDIGIQIAMLLSICRWSGIARMSGIGPAPSSHASGLAVYHLAAGGRERRLERVAAGGARKDRPGNSGTGCRFPLGDPRLGNGKMQACSALSVPGGSSGGWAVTAQNREGNWQREAMPIWAGATG